MRQKFPHVLTIGVSRNLKAIQVLLLPLGHFLRKHLVHRQLHRVIQRAGHNLLEPIAALLPARIRIDFDQPWLGLPTTTPTAQDKVEPKQFEAGFREAESGLGGLHNQLDRGMHFWHDFGFIPQ